MSWAQRSATPRPDAVPRTHDPQVSATRTALKSHWTRLARAMPRGARVLEVGAGSCLVSRWMTAARPDLRVTASDWGDYPLDTAAMGTIRFLVRTRMEDLPFDDGAFDAVVSQFGFEYAERDRALVECVRVMGRGGGLTLVMHAADGAAHTGCALRIEGAQMMVEPPSIFDAFRKAAAIRDPRLRASAMQLGALPQAMRQFARLEALEQAAGVTAPGLKDFLQTAMRLAYAPSFAGWLDGAERQFNEDVFIATQQIKAALAVEDVAALSEQAVALGLTPGPSACTPAGWTWSAVKIA